jgi:hypothetical protein
MFHLHSEKIIARFTDLSKYWILIPGSLAGFASLQPAVTAKVQEVKQ